VEEIRGASTAAAGDSPLTHHHPAEYFGESIGMYFCFIGARGPCLSRALLTSNRPPTAFYNRMMAIPAMLGLIVGIWQCVGHACACVRVA
jgi:hypothetical protein